MTDHGTLTGYTSGRCRCDMCRGAMAAYQRARRADIPQRKRGQEEWGSECVRCENATFGSMVCDECGSHMFTVALWFNTREMNRAKEKLAQAST